MPKIEHTVLSLSEKVKFLQLKKMLRLLRFKVRLKLLFEIVKKNNITMIFLVRETTFT